VLKSGDLCYVRNGRFLYKGNIDHFIYEYSSDEHEVFIYLSRRHVIAKNISQVLGNRGIHQVFTDGVKKIKV
jgi:hypothetical protein